MVYDVLNAELEQIQSWDFSDGSDSAPSEDNLTQTELIEILPPKEKYN